MKLNPVPALAVALLALAAPPASAGSTAATRSGSAAATVIVRLRVTHVAGAALNFGRFTVGPLGGTIAIDAAGTATTTGDVALLPGAATAADSFTLAGDPNRGAEMKAWPGTISFAGHALSFTPKTAVGWLRLDAAGTGAVAITGTLTIPPGTPPGTYTGTYLYSAAYN
ncbi:MAG: DUF4402 domain-containing protein [Sphingomonadales bacterium]|nr:DUF4402 domain-containing protein [Sphingomonadales bacterium]